MQCECRHGILDHFFAHCTAEATCTVQLTNFFTGQMRHLCDECADVYLNVVGRDQVTCYPTETEDEIGG